MDVENNYIINGSMRVTDKAGADKYYLSRVQLESKMNDNPNTIQDIKGNDTYKIDHSKGFDIHDNAGNDKYNIDSMTELSTANWKNNFYIEDDAGNDTYELDGVKFTTSEAINLWDKIGNDKYTFKNSENYYLKDDGGKDTYNITESVNVNIDDNNDGNDKYVITDCNSKPDCDIDISDDSGNDSYKMTNSTGVNIYDYSYGDKKSNDKYEITAGSDDIYISDYSGNETYNIKGSYNKKTTAINWAGSVEIEDGDGNDTYNLQYVNGALTGSHETEIEDVEGTDKYNVVNSKKIDINDYGYKNDTYSISGVETDDVWTYDEYGNEKYTVKGTKNNYLKNVGIDDEGYNYYYNNKHYTSNDTYNIEYLINDSDNWYIWDEGGDNTFNIKNSKLELWCGEEYNYDKDGHDVAGKDKINITNCSLNDGLGVDIYDTYGYSIGTYNIKASSCKITDKGCDDKYTISALENNRVTVEDYGSGYSSDNDSMTISGIAKNDLVFMTNYKKYDKEDLYDDLIAFDSKKGGFVQIVAYFAKDTDGNYSTDHGYGFIEDLKVNKKFTQDDFSDYVEKFNTIRATVTGWLSEHSYDNVYSVLTSERETAATDIADITQLFTANNS